MVNTWTRGVIKNTNGMIVIPATRERLRR